MSIGRVVTALAAVVALAAIASGTLQAAGTGAAATVEPVKLTVGYQPYYAESWSGVIMRKKEFWRKYLPAGSDVSFQIGLQGSIIVSQMLAGNQQIGYMGDMPAVVGASRRSIRDLRIVATLGLARDQCAVFLVRPDAPRFATQRAAVQWMDGKTVATPQGSCTDRIAQATFINLGVKPKEYLNQPLDVISSSFQNGKIDAAIVWEPTASRLVNHGLARRVASGAFAKQRDAGYMLMSKQLLDERPDIAEAWLKAELDAQRFLVNPKNAGEIAQIALEQTQGFEKQDLWDALYRKWPTAVGGPTADGIRITLPFVISKEARRHITTAAIFLNQIKSIEAPKLPAGAVDGTLAAKVFKASGSKKQIVGVVKALNKPIG